MLHGLDLQLIDQRRELCHCGVNDRVEGLVEGDRGAPRLVRDPVRVVQLLPEPALERLLHVAARLAC